MLGDEDVTVGTSEIIPVVVPPLRNEDIAEASVASIADVASVSVSRIAYGDKGLFVSVMALTISMPTKGIISHVIAIGQEVLILTTSRPKGKRNDMYRITFGASKRIRPKKGLKIL